MYKSFWQPSFQEAKGSGFIFAEANLSDDTEEHQDVVCLSWSRGTSVPLLVQVSGAMATLSLIIASPRAGAGFIEALSASGNMDFMTTKKK